VKDLNIKFYEIILANAELQNTDLTDGPCEANGGQLCSPSLLLGNRGNVAVSVRRGQLGARLARFVKTEHNSP